MEKDQKGFTPKQPDFKGSLDVSAWKNVDKNGKTYISVKFADNVNLFKYEPKQKTTKQEEF